MLNALAFAAVTITPLQMTNDDFDLPPQQGRQHQERTRTMYTRDSNRTGAARTVGFLAIAAVVAVLALAACDSASPQPSAAASASEEIQSAVTTLLQALVTADLPTLQKMHAADYQLVTPDGTVLSRDDFLNAVGSGALDYRGLEPLPPMQIRVHGDTAAVRYQSTIDIVVDGLGRLKHDAWHTELYERRDGGWQVVWSQATAVGSLPSPEQDR